MRSPEFLMGKLLHQDNTVCTHTNKSQSFWSFRSPSTSCVVQWLRRIARSRVYSVWTMRPLCLTDPGIQQVQCWGQSCVPCCAWPLVSTATGLPSLALPFNGSFHSKLIWTLMPPTLTLTSLTRKTPTSVIYRGKQTLTSCIPVRARHCDIDFLQCVLIVCSLWRTLVCGIEQGTTELASLTQLTLTSVSCNSLRLSCWTRKTHFQTQLYEGDNVIYVDVCDGACYIYNSYLSISLLSLFDANNSYIYVINAFWFANEWFNE